LNFRLKRYWDTVDYFVISESRFAFNGTSKPLHAANFIKKHKINDEKIIIIEYIPTNEMILNSKINRWPIENFARQSLLNGLLSANDDDIVILSDADEFASIEQIENAAKGKDILSAQTPMFFRKGNFLVAHSKKWNRVRIGPRKKMVDLNLIRDTDYPRANGEVGMHLSYLELSDSDVLRKHKTSAHSEIDEDPNFLTEALKIGKIYGIDHLGRFESKKFGLLKILKRTKLNKFQISFLINNPEYFDFNPIQKNYFRRISASRRLTNAWKYSDIVKVSEIEVLSSLTILIDVLFALRIWIKKCSTFPFKKINFITKNLMTTLEKKLDKS
jgi:hypothetical protein